jgi:hypothetical protein
MAKPAAALADVDLIAYTRGPGWPGALLVGAGVAVALGGRWASRRWACTTWRGICCRPSWPTPRRVSLRGAAGLGRPHAVDATCDGVGRYALLGETIDDAAGEAFDKSAKLLGLGYPGWAGAGAAGRLRATRAFALPRPLLHSGDLDFSFAGLKTAVLTPSIASWGRRPASSLGRPGGLARRRPSSTCWWPRRCGAEAGRAAAAGGGRRRGRQPAAAAEAGCRRRPFGRAGALPAAGPVHRQRRDDRAGRRLALAGGLGGPDGL